MTKKKAYGSVTKKVLSAIEAYPNRDNKFIGEKVGCHPNYVAYVRRKSAKIDALLPQEKPVVWNMCKHGYNGNEYCPACANEASVEPTPEMLEAVLEAEAILTPEAVGGIDAILNERGSRYGSFVTHAYITQRIKAVMSDTPNWIALSDDMIEALEMIAHKIGRILNGDPAYPDSWVDIAGYAQLVADRLEGKVR